MLGGVAGDPASADAGGEEEVPEGGACSRQRPSARASRRTDRRVRHLGRSRWCARVHRPRNARIAASPLPWPRRPGVGSPQRLLFVGVDRPGYGYSDPWPEATLLDCAGDFVRVADDLGLERFAALGFSGGAPYVLALGVLVPQRLRGVDVVSGLGMLDRPGRTGGDVRGRRRRDQDGLGSTGRAGHGTR
jgi:hypothetical protein